MKKNTIKKSLSIMATLSLFAVSTACYSVSAAETDVNLYIDRITAKPGETVSVNVGTRNSNVAYDTVGLLINYDEGLTYGGIKENYHNATPNSSGNNLFFTISKDAPIKGDQLLITYNFTVPENAAPGTRYNIQFTNLLNAEGQPDPTLAIARRLNLYNVSVDSNAFLPYTVEQGYIEIAAEETTVTTVTTVTTTPEVTDTDPGTTPASGSSVTDITTAVTTSSSTTGSSTTTTSTSKASTSSSPKTGDATKGVIPAMAAMAAAAVAAFVVRKKK